MRWWDRTRFRVLIGRAGLSLVEFMVCIAFLGLLTMASVEALQGMIPTARVNCAARELAALLEWSRWSAVRGGCPYRVVVDPEIQQITVYKETVDGSGTDGKVVARVMDVAREHQGVVLGTARGVHRTSGCKPVDPSGVHLRGACVRFLPTGVTDRCGSLYLIPKDDIPDRKDRMRAISILLATGRLQLWRYEPFEASGCEEGGLWVPM